MSFKTKFEEIKTKPDLENKINSNIEHRQSPVFLFYFKVPPRGLIWLTFIKILNSILTRYRTVLKRFRILWNRYKIKRTLNDALER